MTSFLHKIASFFFNAIKARIQKKSVKRTGTPQNSIKQEHDWEII